jgi:lambda family phage minor tail protein L
MRVANITGVVGALCLAYQDLIGAKVTRKRTLLKYLDAENFVSGQNPTADPNVGFPDEVYFVNRKVAENNIYLEFELASAWDVAGVKLPRRQVIQNLCPWKYRGTECGYTGGPKANIYDQSTSDPDEDQCGKRLSSCKIRFGANSNLPFGGFPGVGMVRTG